MHPRCMAPFNKEAVLDGEEHAPFTRRPTFLYTGKQKTRWWNGYIARQLFVDITCCPNGQIHAGQRLSDGI